MMLCVEQEASTLNDENEDDENEDDAVSDDAHGSRVAPSGKNGKVLHIHRLP